MASAILTKFQEMLAISKIMEHLELELGIEDKVLAEFVLNLARNSKSVDLFVEKLTENGANFNENTSNSIFALVTRILPSPE